MTQFKAAFSVPYDKNLSKNQRYVSRNKKAINPKHQQARNDVTLLCKNAIRKQCYRLQDKQRIQVDMMVYKPHNMGDAHNFIDDALDAIEKATGIDDKYYSVSCDWDIDRDNPRIEFTITTYNKMIKEAS